MRIESKSLPGDLRSVLAAHSPSPLVTSLFLASALQALLERHWIMSREPKSGPAAFDDFVALALARELAPLRALAPWLGPELSASRLKTLTAAARDLSKTLVAESRRYEPTEYRTFLSTAIGEMAALCAFEENLAAQRSDHYLPPSAYRAFDAFDEIFGLAFDTDQGVKQDPKSQERLYLGGGAGVQTSYATLLTALDNLRLPEGGHLIDLGSGLGRVGLLAGLWRADLRFTGYEYVGPRVKAANDAADRAGLAERILFTEQNLADPAFRIPLADAYYMYDPFCAETYERVLRQLNAYSLEHAITVVTKAGAGGWFAQLQEQGSWAEPEPHDSGLLLMFRSKPSPWC
jgi:hypothetical protein